MAVAGDAGRKVVISALREQQEQITSDAATTLPGEVLTAVLLVAKPGGSVRPGDVARRINQDRASAEDVDLERLKDRITPNKVGWLLGKVLELPRVRDRSGTSYVLEPGRLHQLCRRYAIEPPPTPENLPSLQHCHTATTLPHENGLFEPESTMCGNVANVASSDGSTPTCNTPCHGATDCSEAERPDVPKPDESATDRAWRLRLEREHAEDSRK
jgi:hypothetical protein